MEEDTPSTTPLIAQVVESFITSVESLAETFPLAMNAIAISKTKIEKEIFTSLLSLIGEFLEFHHVSIKSRDDITQFIEGLSEEEREQFFKNKPQEISDRLQKVLQEILNDVSWMKSSSQRLPSITEYVRKEVENGKKMDVANKLVMQSFIISLISQYDTFLGKLIRALFLIKPETLNVSERNISFSQLREFNTIDDAREYVMGKEIESILRGSHIEQFKWLENKYGMELRKGLTVWPTFVEVTERRNLFTHSSGIVSDQYIDVCEEHGVQLAREVRIGTELDVTPDYFELAYESIFEIGVKLAHVLWRKVAPQDLEDADGSLIAICYNLLQKGHYKLACVLLDFATETLKKYSNDNNRRIFIINRAQAYKWAGEDEKAEMIVKSADWSASSDKFKLAEAVLLDDFDAADYLVKKIGSQGDVKMFDYREWPLFIGV